MVTKQKNGVNKLNILIAVGVLVVLGLLFFNSGITGNVIAGDDEALNDEAYSSCQGSSTYAGFSTCFSEYESTSDAESGSEAYPVDTTTEDSSTSVFGAMFAFFFGPGADSTTETLADEPTVGTCDPTCDIFPRAPFCLDVDDDGTFSCEMCLADGDCNFGEECVTNTCYSNCGDGNCIAGEDSLNCPLDCSNTIDGICEVGEETTADCDGVCDPVDNRITSPDCIYTCVDDTECSNGDTCQDGTCLPDIGPVGCSDDSDCSTGHYCDIALLVCTVGDTLHCIGDSDCDNSQICFTGYCIDSECTSESDCSTGERCIGHVCIVQDSCSDNSDCVEGTICNGGFCDFITCPSTSCPAGTSCTSTDPLVVGVCIIQDP
jgi:hypothetical protein